MTWSTPNVFLATFLRSAGFVMDHTEEGDRHRRYCFHDSEKLRWAVSQWKAWGGDNFRKEYKRINAPLP